MRAEAASLPLITLVHSFPISQDHNNLRLVDVGPCWRNSNNQNTVSLKCNVLAEKRPVSLLSNSVSNRPPAIPDRTWQAKKTGPTGGFNVGKKAPAGGGGHRLAFG